jgi:hypothetical protein
MKIQMIQTLKLHLWIIEIEYLKHHYVSFRSIAK